MMMKSEKKEEDTPLWRTVCHFGISGILLGITISYLVTVIISLCIGDGQFYPVVPETVHDFGSQINAVLVQTVMSAFWGFCIGVGRLILKHDSWSLVRQIVLHFLVVCVAVLPAAWLCRWMNHSLKGILLYIGIMVSIYVFIWFAEYIFSCRDVKKMDDELKKRKGR
jgi:hypothetical protein